MFVDSDCGWRQRVAFLFKKEKLRLSGGGSGSGGSRRAGEEEEMEKEKAEGEEKRGCGGKGNACCSSLDKGGENAASDSCKKQNGASAASCAMMGKRGKEMGGQERGRGGKGIERNEALETSAQHNSREHREERKRR